LPAATQGESGVALAACDSKVTSFAQALLKAPGCLFVGQGESNHEAPSNIETARARTDVYELPLDIKADANARTTFDISIEGP
jgi:hypothetical protein